MEKFSQIKMILFLSFLSFCLSFGVLSNAYTKETFASRDKRFVKAYNLVVSRAIEMYGGYRNAKVYPIAAYRNLNNGLSYKVIIAVRNEKKKKVDLVASEVYTGPFLDTNGEPKIAREKFFHKYDEEKLVVLPALQNFVYSYLEFQEMYTKIIRTVFRTGPVNNESFYLVHIILDSELECYFIYLIISLVEGQGFTVVHIFDFPNY